MPPSIMPNCTTKHKKCTTVHCDSKAQSSIDFAEQFGSPFIDISMAGTPSPGVHAMFTELTSTFDNTAGQ